MRLAERMRSYNQLEISLLAVLANTVISLGIFVYYIYQGLTNDYFGYSDDYFGSDPASYGNLLFDIINVVLITAVVVLIGLAIKKKQSHFLLLSGIFFLVSIFLSQSSLIYIGSVIICGFGYYYMKKEERDSEYRPKKTYLVTVVFSLYVMNLILAAIPLGVYLIDVIQSGTSKDAGINILDFVVYVLPFMLLLTAAILMYFAVRERGYIWSKLGVDAFLLYYLMMVIPYGELDTLLLGLYLPVSLLSIYLLVHRESSAVQMPVMETNIPDEG